MNWHDLLFMHWPVPADLLRALVPPPLQIDTFDSRAWLGVIPFRMTGVRPRSIPARLWGMDFPELNVRTYVTHEDKPGVWFFSLDAANRMAVLTARMVYHLPYYHASMSSSALDGIVRYESKRIHKGEPAAAFSGSYYPAGSVASAATGSIEYWLAERYCLYAADRHGAVFRGEIHHLPWPLQPAESEIRLNTMTEPLGIRLPQIKPLLHFAKELNVVAWPLQRCSAL